MNVDKITIFIFQAYDDDSEGKTKNVVTLELIDENQEIALTRAKNLVRRNHYRLVQIIEKEIV